MVVHLDDLAYHKHVVAPSGFCFDQRTHALPHMLKLSLFFTHLSQRFDDFWAAIYLPLAFLYVISVSMAFQSKSIVGYACSPNAVFRL